MKHTAVCFTFRTVVPKELNYLVLYFHILKGVLALRILIVYMRNVVSIKVNVLPCNIRCRSCNN